MSHVHPHKDPLREEIVKIACAVAISDLLVGIADALLRCDASLSTCCTIIAFKGSLLLAQEISAKGLEKLVDLDGQQYQKIGRFVNLHPLHH